MRITHYFAPMSGYAYLGIAALREIGARHKVEILHAPVDIQAAFSVAGVTPPAIQSPAKKAYRAKDMMRWAQRRDLPLNPQPKFWPVASALASRFIIAAESISRSGALMSEAVLTAVWVRDLDIAKEETLVRLVDECGLDVAAISQAANEDSTQAMANQYTADALALGLFGSPTYLFAGEIYFGQDRLDFLEEEIIKQKSGMQIA
jgi:2-hydroxychromene-2-carboxylate isomerase